MKLLALLLFLLAVASAEAETDPCTTQVHNRKMKLTVHGGFMCPNLEKQTRNVQHQLLETPNSVKNAAIYKGAFPSDSSTASDVNSNVGQAADPATAGRDGSKNDYVVSVASHHSVDLQTWNNQHPPKPEN